MGGGQYRGPAANPCQSEDDAYQRAVSHEQKTQRELNWVNSAENEKAVRSGGNKKSIADWEANVKNATEKNNDAAVEVGKAQKRLDACTKKHETGMGQPR